MKIPLHAAVEKQFGPLALLPERQRVGIESFLQQLEHLSSTRVWLLAPDFRPPLK